MKKEVIKVLSLLFMAIMAVGVASCGSDSEDDNGGGGNSGNLDTPKYESASALFNISDADSKYESVEFTASGNYIITTRNTSKAPHRIAAARQFGPKFLPSVAGVTRSSGTYGNIIYGTYTKNGDTYVLDGFGTIVVNGGGSNAISLDITTNGGSKVTVGAQQEQQYTASSKTNMLCRTWKFDKIRLYVKANGQVLDQTYNSYREFLIALWKMEGEDFDEKELQQELVEEPQQVIFTKSGTYVVFYSGGTLAVSTWKWQDEASGKARYSWDYQYIDDPTMSGVINISFSGNQLVITEYLDREGYDEYTSGYEGYIQYFMSEVK